MSAPEAQALWHLAAPLLAAVPRIGAAVTVAPLFPSSLFPPLLRLTIVLSLSLFLYPHLAAHLPAASAPLMLMALVGKEVFIGALLGFAVGTLVWAFESAAAILDFQIGFSNAQFFDPFGGHDGGPLAGFMTQLGIMLFIVSGGLLVFAALLFESFHLWPVASFYPVIGERLAQHAGDSLGSILQLVVRLATPAVFLLALVDLGFGLVGRVVPQLNVFYFTMPIKGALAALMIALYLSYMGDVVRGEIIVLQHWLDRSQPVLAPQ